MGKELTSEEAYAAMYSFLSHYYELTQADDIGALLGAMSRFPDGSPADLAFEGDWKVAVEKAKAGRVETRLKLRKL